MYKDWSPKELGGLFCDRKDWQGLYYWYDKILEKKKALKLKPGETMKTTYEIILNG